MARDGSVKSALSAARGHEGSERQAEAGDGLAFKTRSRISFIERAVKMKVLTEKFEAVNYRQDGHFSFWVSRRSSFCPSTFVTSLSPCSQMISKPTLAKSYI